MRINKYLASLGVASRRKIDEYIDEKRLKVNNIVAYHGMEVSSNDKILLDDRIISINKKTKEYYMLNKPLRVISSVSDERGRKTVVDLINTDSRIFPIGRLDYMTTGLIILTNDGEIFNKLIHPKKEIFKNYLVSIKGKIILEHIKKIEDGIIIDGVKTLPAKVEVLKIDNNTKLRISIREGRNRQIRKMLGKFGYQILSLSRESIGDISIGNLKIGEFRKLNQKEIDYLKSL